MEISEILKAGRAKEKGDCILCEKPIQIGDPQVFVEVTIGSKFIKALQSKLTRGAHVVCAKLIHGKLGQRIDEAERL